MVDVSCTHASASVTFSRLRYNSAVTKIMPQLDSHVQLKVHVSRSQHVMSHVTRSDTTSKIISVSGNLNQNKPGEAISQVTHWYHCMLILVGSSIKYWAQGAGTQSKV